MKCDVRKDEPEKPITDYVNEMVIVLTVVDDPYKRTRHLAKELPFSAKSISQMLQTVQFEPHHIQILQELHNMMNQPVFLTWRFFPME